MSLLFNRLGPRAALLLMLAAAVVGFFLLIDFLVALTSSGPDDLLAAMPSEDEHIGLPSGAEMFAFAVGAVGVVLGIVALLAPRHWTLRGRIPHPRRSLTIGAVIALVLAGAGLYLAFSGVLSEDITYGQHQAQRMWVEPIGLAVLAGFFLSLAVVAIVSARLLLVHLAIWLVLALVFGFFVSPSLAGLMFFERSENIESQTAYAAEVEKYRSPEDESAPPAATGWDAMLPLETGSAVLVRDDSAVLLMPGVSAAPAANSIPNPLFIVTGAAHTSFLRSATGDVYQNGEWTQLDPVRLQVEAGSDIAAGILAMIEEGLVEEDVTEDGQNVALPLHRAKGGLVVPARLRPGLFAY